jgi:hypothetical protein
MKVRFIFRLLPLVLYLACRRQEKQVVQQEADAPIRKEIVAADPPEEEPFNNIAEIDSLAEAINLDVDSHPQAAAGNTFIFNPFGVDEREESPFPGYRQKIKAPVALQKQTVRNRHNWSQIDTLYHLRFDSSTISFYYPVLAERYLLSSADIRSPNIALEDNIRIGMSRDELLKKLRGYSLYIKEQGDSIEVTALITDTSLIFKLQQGKLRQIKYHPYLD